jgi:hypothetical protein
MRTYALGNKVVEPWLLAAKGVVCCDQINPPPKAPLVISESTNLDKNKKLILAQCKNKKTLKGSFISKYLVTWINCF